MPSTPSHITVKTISGAKYAVLKFWINEANRFASAKVLTKSGKVDELRAKLANYYSIDMQASEQVEPIILPLTVNQSIQENQWDHLLALGDEWSEALEAGRPFRLIDEEGE